MTSSKTPNNVIEGAKNISHSVNAPLAQAKSEVEGYPVNQTADSKPLMKVSIHIDGEKGTN